MRAVISFSLPLPPSGNSLWRSNRGRVHRSKRYRAFLTEAGWELLRQRPAHITGWVQVTISAGRPDRRRRDCDNLSKSLLDLLVQHRVIEDDSLVAQIITRWDPSVAAGRVLVEVESVPAPGPSRVAEIAAARGLDL